MSSTETINQLRQQRDAMLAGIKYIQDQLEMHQESIEDLEAILEEGDERSLDRPPQIVKARSQMETLKVVSSPNRQIQSLMLYRNNRRI